MTPISRMLERAIRAAETERSSCQARITDLSAFIRLLREALENEEEPTLPDAGRAMNGGAR